MRDRGALEMATIGARVEHDNACHRRMLTGASGGRSRSATPLPRGRVGFLWFGALTFVVATLFIVDQRASLVGAVPGLAGLFRAVGLPVNVYQADFVNVRATLEGDGVETRLVVEGQIHNLRNSENRIPDVQIALLAENGAPVYAWAARLPQNRIAARSDLKFRTTLEGPPSGPHKVRLKFAE